MLISNGALHNRRSLLRRSTYRLWQSALMLSFHSLRATHHCSCHTENMRLLTAVSRCSRAADGNTLPNTHLAQMVRYFLARNLPTNACKDKQSWLLHFKHGNLWMPVGIVLEQLARLRALHCTGTQNSNQLCGRHPLFVQFLSSSHVYFFFLLPMYIQGCR